MKKPSMREEMPAVAAFIDALREAFGATEIDGQIRKGMRGEPTFYASENGHTVGTKLERGRAIKWDELGISYEVNVKTIGIGE